MSEPAKTKSEIRQRIVIGQGRHWDKSWSDKEMQWQRGVAWANGFDSLAAFYTWLDVEYPSKSLKELKSTAIKETKEEIKIRPEIQAFAEWMERLMAAHDEDRGDSRKKMDDSFLLGPTS